ncbi:tyrosine protein kinase [Parabacteroides sp. OttesenSCG-928-G07]|nr:tyrosine protein kinase [Parabacteroides sp. OttesenSCG-928-G21]MDL2278828.1 tyrosine protein kinase [Parabacteroides sp. OttesenSCG-928-G07]
MKVEINPVYNHLSSFIKSIPSKFDSLGTIIYQARNTLRLIEVGGLPLVVKRFKRAHIINRFIYGTFRSSKAERSYINAVKLLEKGVNTPIPVGYIEEYKFGLRYSYYITLKASFAHEIREFCDMEDVEPYSNILEAFGLFTARLHNKEVIHVDYSPGNILFDFIHNKPVFTVVDINRLRFGKLTEEQSYHNLRRLWLTDQAYTIIARSYAKGRGFDEEKAIERILYHKNKFMANRYK